MNIFIHYLDKELLDTYQPKLKYSEDIVNKVRLSIKIAILLLERNDHVFVPVSNYFESELPKIVLDYFRNIIDLDCIKLVSSSKSLQSFIKKKRLVYPSIYSKNQILEENEKILEHGVPGIWTPRSNSATLDITTSWIENVDSSFWSKLYNYSNYNNPSAFEKAIASVPQKLNNKAFIANHVLSKLDLKSEYQIESKETLNSFISKFYIKSFLEEYNAVCFRNFFLLSQADEILPDGYKHIDYGNLCRILSGIEYEKQSLYEYIYGCNNFELMLLKEQKLFNEIRNNKMKKYYKLEKEKKMKTFIVHGHNSEDKLALKNYIQNTLKMEEPIVLAEKASGGLTIIEKFEKYAEDSRLVFVLLTPDDKYSEDNTMRARQNVIFELGYFLGKLGRHSGSVILLYKGKLELPSDIYGLTYIQIDNGIEAAGEEIRREINELQDNN